MKHKPNILWCIPDRQGDPTEPQPRYCGGDRCTYSEKYSEGGLGWVASVWYCSRGKAELLNLGIQGEHQHFKATATSSFFFQRNLRELMGRKGVHNVFFFFFFFLWNVDERERGGMRNSPEHTPFSMGFVNCWRMPCASTS